MNEINDVSELDYVEIVHALEVLGEAVSEVVNAITEFINIFLDYFTKLINQTIKLRNKYYSKRRLLITQFRRKGYRCHLQKKKKN